MGRGRQGKQDKSGRLADPEQASDGLARAHPFAEFQVPQASLRLRQGFGRLIRTRTDRGAVVLLDRRAIMREYGARMLASLPDARLHRVPRDDVAATVAAFCKS